jgi:hypothetical protein
MTRQHLLSHLSMLCNIISSSPAQLRLQPYTDVCTAMIFKEAPRIAAMLGSLIVGKAAVIALLSLAFGMSFANAQRSGLLLAQGGESVRVCVCVCVCVRVRAIMCS